MNIKVFLDLVEFRTKVASIIPFITGIIYTLYRYERFDLELVVLFFVSMICIDMATTAMNHLSDSKRAIHKSGYNYESHNAVVKYGITDTVVKLVIVSLLIIGSVAGIVLFLKTDAVILLAGVFAFGIGILYSNGPIPISGIPLGEITSGILMGGVIFFVTVYMQIFESGIVIYHLSDMNFTLKLDLVELISIAIASIPLVLMISNIMLSNNICDLEDDVKNKRFTLPYYTGKKIGLLIYEWSYYSCYIAIVVGVILKFLPVTTLLALLTVMPIRKNIGIFKEKQDKATTFSLAIKNFFILGFAYIVTLLISLINFL